MCPCACLCTLLGRKCGWQKNTLCQSMQVCMCEWKRKSENFCVCENFFILLILAVHVHTSELWEYVCEGQSSILKDTGDAVKSLWIRGACLEQREKLKDLVFHVLHLSFSGTCSKSRAQPHPSPHMEVLTTLPVQKYTTQFTVYPFPICLLQILHI